MRWGSYFIIDKVRKELLGTCCFKGKPDDLNIVEIGYEIKTAYQNNGLATEVAKALVQFAISQGVSGIRAHTLNEVNPSVKVLQKSGFHFEKEINDPADGIIWQWLLLHQFVKT